VTVDVSIVYASLIVGEVGSWYAGTVISAYINILKISEIDLSMNLLVWH